MTEKLFHPDHPQNWESVHVCPNCEHIINLAEIDLRAVTTGIVSCPQCEWAGRIEIQIVGTNGTGANVKPDDQQ